MKKVFIFACFALALLHAPSVAEACAPFDPAWQGCTRSDDCALATDICGGPAAYNRRFLGEADASNKCAALLVDCPLPAETSGKPTAVCVAAKCTVKFEKLIAPAQP